MGRKWCLIIDVKSEDREVEKEGEETINSSKNDYKWLARRLVLMMMITSLDSNYSSWIEKRKRGGEIIMTVLMIVRSRSPKLSKRVVFTCVMIFTLTRDRQHHSGTHSQVFRLQTKIRSNQTWRKPSQESTGVLRRMTMIIYSPSSSSSSCDYYIMVMMIIFIAIYSCLTSGDAVLLMTDWLWVHKSLIFFIWCSFQNVILTKEYKKTTHLHMIIWNDIFFHEPLKGWWAGKKLMKESREKRRRNCLK